MEAHNIELPMSENADSLAAQLFIEAAKQIEEQRKKVADSIQKLNVTLDNAKSHLIGLNAQATLVAELQNKLKELNNSSQVQQS